MRRLLIKIEPIENRRNEKKKKKKKLNKNAMQNFNNPKREAIVFLILRIYKLLLFINTCIAVKFQTGVTEM